MPDQKLRSQIVSHRVLNYLNAAFQGRFAFFNILSQLKHPFFSIEEIKVTKAVIEQIDRWLGGLWDGKLLFDETRIGKPTQETTRALTLLEQLIPELQDLAAGLRHLFAREGFGSEPQDVAFVVAAFGRNAYARDNYVRGFMEFGRVFNDSNMTSEWRRQLDLVTAEIKHANEFMLLVKENRVDNPKVYDQLRFMSRTLPGIFSAHTHDIRQLLCTHRCEFTFDKAAFEKHEARVWDRAEIGPIEAGYWRAHGFTPEEAQEWKKYEITDPLIASEWLTTGFAPALAAKWLQHQFAPLLALQWQLQNYLPEEAAERVRCGCLTPGEIPEEDPNADDESAAATSEEDADTHED